ncbi:MAG: hypothetical protein PVI01_07870 [Gemmatimonadales bacterium]
MATNIFLDETDAKLTPYLRNPDLLRRLPDDDRVRSIAGHLERGYGTWRNVILSYFHQASIQELWRLRQVGYSEPRFGRSWSRPGSAFRQAAISPG